MFGRKKKPTPDPRQSGPEPKTVETGATLSPVDGSGNQPSNSEAIAPDYSQATTLIANHIVVSAGKGKVVLDLAESVQGAEDGRSLPIHSRVVMSAKTASRLSQALTQGLAKLQETTSKL